MHIRDRKKMSIMITDIKYVSIYTVFNLIEATAQECGKKRAMLYRCNVSLETNLLLNKMFSRI